MLDNQSVRGAVSGVVEPIAKGLLKLGLTANHLTVFTALASSAVAIAFWSRGEFLMGILVGTPFVLGDLLDGTMARLSNSTSKFGSFLDSVMDRVTDGAIFGSLAFWAATTSRTGAFVSALIAMSAAAVVPYARAKAEAIGVSAKVGLMERSDRLALTLFGTICAAAGYSVLLEISLVILAAATTFTVWQRVAAVRRGLADEAL